MKRCDLFINNQTRWIISVSLLVFGSMIYLLYRPQNILLFQITDSIGLSPFINKIREDFSCYTLPAFVINSLPAGLWTASYLILMYSKTKFADKKHRLMLCLPLPISAIMLELIQLLGWCPGVFDVYDLVCYIIPIIIFIKSI